MKNISKQRLNKVSHYYSVLLKVSAIAALAVITVSIVGGLFALLTYDYYGGAAAQTYVFSTVMYILTGAILLAGGFAIGWWVSSGKGLSKRERVVMASTYGLIAYVVYFPLTYLTSLIWFNFAPASSSIFLSVAPLYALLLVGVLGAAARYTRISYKRFTMAALVIAFWLYVLWTAVENVIMLMERDSTDPSLLVGVFIYPLVLILLFTLFYVFIKKIGRLARIFYATFLTVLTTLLGGALGNFSWGPEAYSNNWFGIFVLITLLLFIIATVVKLIWMRRLS